MKKILQATCALSLLLAGAAWAEAPAGEGAAPEPAAEAAPADGAAAAPDPAADPAPEAAAEATGDAAGEAAAAEAAPAPAAPRSATVVEGAPLGNANVYVHTVQKKPFTQEGRHEVALYPANVQVNSKFTTHVGAAATYSYHLFENLALQFTPVFNYLNHESSFNQELITKGHQQAQAATALLLQYGAVAGMEVTPMYGKFALYEGVLGHFTFVLTAGAGAGNTRVQLRGATTSNCGGSGQPECKEAGFGATGAKFLGSVGAGLRVSLGERFAVRLEVKDLVYTARVDRINGCTYEDLSNLTSGQSPATESCQKDAFANPDDKQLAKLLLKETSSDVLNNVSVYTGLSFLF